MLVSTSPRLPFVLALLLVGANLAAQPATAKVESKTCVSAPNATAPSGMHWYYRTDREAKRRCWFLRPLGTKERRKQASDEKALSPKDKSTGRAKRSAAVRDAVAAFVAGPTADSAPLKSSTASATATHSTTERAHADSANAAFASLQSDPSANVSATSTVPATSTTSSKPAAGRSSDNTTTFAMRWTALIQPDSSVRRLPAVSLEPAAQADAPCADASDPSVVSAYNSHRYWWCTLSNIGMATKPPNQ